MKALVLEKDGELALHYRDIPPPLTDDALLIRIVACGICGSDIPRGFGGKAYHYPLVMGHEFSGQVAEDKRGSSFRKGDAVAVFPLLPCKTCSACQTGNYAQCTNYNYFGSRCDGGFEEYLYVPPFNLIPVPEHVDLLHASMTEPAAVALHGVRKLNVHAGDTGVVFGAGPIGNMAAQWLRIYGCRRVVLVDTEESKLEVARGMGFETVNARKSNAVEEVLRLTGGRGAEKLVEAAGVPVTFLQSIQAAARFGEIVFMGNLHGTFQIGEADFTGILRKELTIYGTWNSKLAPRGTDDWSTVLKYMDRELQVDPLISDTPALEDGSQIFDSIIHHRKVHHKVIFKIGAY